MANRHIQSELSEKPPNQKERIISFLQQEGITKNHFYKRTGIANGTLDKKSGITGETILKIYTAFPNINLEWLITGQGEMHKLNIPLCPSILKTKEQYSAPLDFSINNVSDKEITISSEFEPPLEFIPLFTYRNAQQLEGYISIPNIANCDGAGYIKSNNMYPLLKPGDIVCCKSANDIDSVIHWGEMYVIYVKIDGEEVLTIKYINKSDLGEEYVLLSSHNPEYKPKDIPLEDIKWKAMVKASIQYNSIL